MQNKVVLKFNLFGLFENAWFLQKFFIAQLFLIPDYETKYQTKVESKVFHRRICKLSNVLIPMYL